MQVSETVLHKAAHDGVVLQNADTIFMYSQPNTNTGLRRGRDGLKQTEQRMRLVTSMFSRCVEKLQHSLCQILFTL